MYYPLWYRKVAPQRYSVFFSSQFIGEVTMVEGSWRFRTFEPFPAFVSFVPAHTRYEAVVQWPGLSDLC